MSGQSLTTLLCTSPHVHVYRLLSSFDRIGEALHLFPGAPFTVNRTSFTLDFVELTSEERYSITFGTDNGDQVNLPKSLFGGNVNISRVSSSQILKTALFRGRDESIIIGSNILSINVLEQEVKALTEPVTIRFKKIAPVSTYSVQLLNTSTIS